MCSIQQCTFMPVLRASRCPKYSLLLSARSDFTTGEEKASKKIGPNILACTFQYNLTRTLDNCSPAD